MVRRKYHVSLEVTRNNENTVEPWYTFLKCGYSTMHHEPNCLTASYSAFCRNFGNHTTEKVGTHNWNEEAIEQMTRELTTPWQELRSAIKSNIESYCIFIEELMDWVIDYLGKFQGQSLLVK
jgi:hypothetical protein